MDEARGYEYLQDLHEACGRRRQVKILVPRQANNLAHIKTNII